MDPVSVFTGRILVCAPHMDDCVLACGATLAQLPNKDYIHIVYATDGRASPAPVFPWKDRVPADLGALRKSEAIAALGTLGIPPSNLHFLNFPDGGLKKHGKALQEALLALSSRLAPDHILIPFRYDRHPDHLAVNQVLTQARESGKVQASLMEYFVYFTWKLLPGGDLRSYIHPGLLIQVEPEQGSAAKREALDQFKTQTTRYYPWQTRPNLTPTLLAEVSQSPEYFLEFDPTQAGAAVLTRLRFWIRMVHRLEPRLKQAKDQLVAVLDRGGRNDA